MDQRQEEQVLPTEILIESMKWLIVMHPRVELVFSLGAISRSFREAFHRHPIQWSSVKQYYISPDNKKASNNLCRSILYCEVRMGNLKESMLSFIKNEKLVYRSPKTDRILAVGDSMKKIKTLPNKINTVKKREYLRDLIREYERLNTNKRKMLNYGRWK